MAFGLKAGKSEIIQFLSLGGRMKIREKMTHRSWFFGVWTAYGCGRCWYAFTWGSAYPIYFLGVLWGCRGLFFLDAIVQGDGSTGPFSASFLVRCSSISVMSTSGATADTGM